MKRFSLGLVTGLVAGLLLATTTFVLAADQIKLIVNGKEINSDVPPQIIDGRTMVPARFLAEALGASVSWDEANNAVIVTSQGYSQTTNSDIDQWNKDMQDIINRIFKLTVEASDADKLESYMDMSKALNNIALKVNPILQDTLGIIPPDSKKEAHNYLIEYLKAEEGYFNARSYWAMYIYFNDNTKATTYLNKANYYFERADSMINAFQRYR